jgi:hypothetical protein
LASVPVVSVSTGKVAVSPAYTVTAAPFVFVLAVLVNSAVLFVRPVVAPRLATLPAMLFAPHAFARRNVVLLRVLV